jgi:hypothetical protein
MEKEKSAQVSTHCERVSQDIVNSIYCEGLGPKLTDQRYERAARLVQALFLLAQEAGGGIGEPDGWAVQIVQRALAGCHPTHQQDFWRLIKELIFRYADLTSPDARNEAAVDWCRRAADVDGYMPRI